MLNDKGYDGRAADIWSCGVILYVLLAGFLPFDEPHMSALFRKIQKAEFTYPSWFSPQVRHLIDRLLVADPAKRASLTDIEADPWFLGPDGYHDTETSAPISIVAGGAGATSHPVSGGGVAEVDATEDVAEAVEDPVEASPATAVAAAAVKGKGPAALNAFEVVNMFGGLALNRLLETTDKRDKLLSVTPQFISAMPANVVLTRISTSLATLGAEVTVDDEAYKVKGRFVTGKGTINVVVQIFAISDELHLVELKRGKGDILEYNSIYMKLRESLADLVTKGSVSRMGK